MATSSPSPRPIRTLAADSPRSDRRGLARTVEVARRSSHRLPCLLCGSASETRRHDSLISGGTEPKANDGRQMHCGRWSVMVGTIAHDLRTKYGNVDHLIVGRRSVSTGLQELDRRRLGRPGIAIIVPRGQPDAAWSAPRVSRAVRGQAPRGNHCRPGTRSSWWRGRRPNIGRDCVVDTSECRFLARSSSAAPATAP